MSTRKQRKSRERTARNFIKRYGRRAFSQLIRDLKSGVSGVVLGARYDVTRERIRQWKNAFGVSIRIYRPYPEIEDILQTGGRHG